MKIHAVNARRAFGSVETMEAYKIVYPRRFGSPVSTMWARGMALGVEITPKLEGLSCESLDIVARLRGLPLSMLRLKEAKEAAA